MAVYAIGDVQGCYDDLARLLDKIAFDVNNDTLWFCGDIINRGPKSLQTIRFIQSLGENAITVLGNHDLHFLAIAATNGKPSRYDTLDEILNAPDREELIDWLLQQKLLHHDSELNISMVHAGIPPHWNLQQARQHARELETLLQSDQANDFFKVMYGNQPAQWHDDLSGWDRYRYITNVFTRMRFCNLDGRPDFKYKGDIGTQPDHLLPWFQHPQRKTHRDEIIFGHWSTLRNSQQGNIQQQNIYPLDTGCLWCGKLSALKITDTERQLIQVDCPNGIRPTGQD